MNKSFSLNTFPSRSPGNHITCVHQSSARESRHEDYRFGLVDGKVSGQILVNGMTIGIYTDFKRKGLGRLSDFASRV